MADINDFNRTIIEEFRSHGGKVGGPFAGTPVLLLGTTGAKSGEQRTTPVVYLPDGERMIIFASKAGAPENPAWYHNIRANPTVTVEVGNDSFAANATVLDGEERDRLRTPGRAAPAVRRIRATDLARDPRDRAGACGLARSVANADEMLEGAAARAQQLAAPGLSPRPRRRVAVLACMDTRIDLFPMLGLQRGDAHIIRNAGGLATDDAIRSLSASQRLLGTDEVVVVMHDGCGLHGASEDEFAAALAGDGALPTWRLGAFDDVERALRQSLARLRSSR